MDVARRDRLAAVAWLGIATYVVAFWFAVGWGVSRAVGAIWPSSQPHCTYSGVDMHATFGTSSAVCEQP